MKLFRKSLLILTIFMVCSSFGIVDTKQITFTEKIIQLDSNQQGNQNPLLSEKLLQKQEKQEKPTTEVLQEGVLDLSKQISQIEGVEGILPLSQHSARIVDNVTYHDYEGIALDMDERERLAHDLGPNSRCMVLRNHGLLTLGKTVRDAFMLMYNMEMSCRVQVDAMAAGRDKPSIAAKSPNQSPASMSR